MTRDEKGILLRLLGAGYNTERPASREAYKTAMSRLIARGLVVNRRWGYSRGFRRYGRNSYQLTPLGLTRAARLAVGCKSAPADPWGRWPRFDRPQKKPRPKLRARYDSYGKVVYG